MDKTQRELAGKIARTMTECVAQLANIPSSRETALAITNAQTAVMWINKASSGAEYSGEGMITS